MMNFNSKDYTFGNRLSVFGLMGNQIVYPENNQAPHVFLDKQNKLVHCIIVIIFQGWIKLLLF